MDNHTLEDLAAKLWSDARDHASIMDSRTHIQRLTAGLAKVRDSYAQAVLDKDETIDRLHREANTHRAAIKRLVEQIRKDHKTCPFCKVTAGNTHPNKCIMQKIGPGKWEPISGSKDTEQE